MPIRSFELTPELDRFINGKVESGAFRDASEVVGTALASLELEGREDEAKMLAVIRAVDEGEASGIAEGDVFERIREARRLRRQQPVRVG